MATELPPLDLGTIPDLAPVVEEMQRTRQPRRIRRAQQDVAILQPLTPAPKKRRKTGVLRADDPLFDLIGIGRSGIPGGISGKQHEAFGRLRHTHYDH